MKTILGIKTYKLFLYIVGEMFCCVVVVALSFFLFGIPINLFSHFSPAEIDASRSESSYQTSKGLFETSVSVGIRFLCKNLNCPNLRPKGMNTRCVLWLKPPTCILTVGP